MMSRIGVHPYARKHGLIDDEITYAWEHFVACGHRVVPDREMRIGFTRFGREVEMVGAWDSDRWLIVHAISPATKRMLKELDVE